MAIGIQKRIFSRVFGPCVSDLQVAADGLPILRREGLLCLLALRRGANGNTSSLPTGAMAVGRVSYSPLFKPAETYSLLAASSW